MDTTKMHSEAEVLLAEFDLAVEAQDGEAMAATYDALTKHVWGRLPTPLEWQDWLLIMRAAGRDDVCYRA